MYSVKPIDAEGLLKSIGKTEALLVVENHQRRMKIEGSGRA